MICAEGGMFQFVEAPNIVTSCLEPWILGVWTLGLDRNTLARHRPCLPECGMPNCKVQIIVTLSKAKDSLKSFKFAYCY